MSFILDALKKAEQERLGQRSAFEPVRVEPPRARPRTGPWPQVLGGGLVLLLAGAGALTLGRSGPIEVARPVQAPPVIDRADVEPAAPAPPAAIPRSGDLSPPRKGAAAPPATRPRAPATYSGPAVTSAPPRQAARPLPVETAPRSPADATPSEKAVAKVGPAGPGSGEAVPRMKLEVHLYSESPAARMVFINGRKYVEGEKVEDKYLLERITENGAILTHQGQRLHLVP